MGVNYNLKNDNLLLELVRAANRYSYCCGKDYLFLCLDKNNSNNTFIFVTRYESSSFMHL